jgi:tRNA dimethylallyltransferase
MQFDEGAAAADCKVFVLDWPRPVLHQRIDARVHGMFQRGLVDEVREVQALFGTLSHTALQAVGYREVLEYLNAQRAGQDVSIEETMDRVKTRTRRFAKRQVTWFRSLSECRWVPRCGEDTPSAVAEQMVERATCL